MLFRSAASVGIKMNFMEQGIKKEDLESVVEKLSYLAYEDQCSPANPRVPLVNDMKEIYMKAFDTKEFLK